MKAFECKMCGQCCYGKGGIIVEQEEIERIARFLVIAPKVFLARFCEKRNGHVYLGTGPDDFCVFFDQEKACLIHPVKPNICSLWPFYPANVNDKETWELAKYACPGINPDCSLEEFVRQSKE
jgi:Fe-S-cluster containining protein